MATTPFNTTTIIRCGIMPYMERLNAEDSTLQGRLDVFESNCQEFIKANNTNDRVCFGENRGDAIDYPYNGATRRFRLVSSENNVFCYQLILGA